jgi:hypothetical protein
MTTEDKTRPVTDLFEQAMKNYEQAFKTGLKLQEESTRCWTNLFSQGPSTQDCQKKFKNIADELIPQTQKSIDECLKLIEQNGRVSVEVLKKAVAAGQSASVQEAQSRFLGLWESSLNGLRENAVALTQSHTRAVESWIECVRKLVESPVEAKAAKA